MWILQKYVYCFISHNPELCSYVMTDCLLTMGHHQLVQYRMISSCILFYAHGKKKKKHNIPFLVIYPLHKFLFSSALLLCICMCMCMCMMCMYMYIYIYIHTYPGIVSWPGEVIRCFSPESRSRSLWRTSPSTQRISLVRVDV